MPDLGGRKLVVLGASAGIGQALTGYAVKAGADVLMCGRRKDRLEALASELGGGTPLAVDLSSDADIERLGTETARFGPVDAIVSTVGLADLKMLTDMTSADWRKVLDTNLIGISCAIRAMLPSAADGAMVLALSSETTDAPRWALIGYTASKAALEVTISGWQLEYPRLRFGVVGVGATVPTEFGRDFEGQILGDALDTWARHGQAQEKFMECDHVGGVLSGMLSTLLPYPDINLEHVILRTPSPVIGSSESMREVALG